MVDAVILSDLHLGSHLCRAEALTEFLGQLEESPPRRLVLNGDVLQDTEHRLTRRHWKVLSTLRRLSDRLQLAWVQGNHDWNAESAAHLVGAEFTPSFTFESGSATILCTHGHAWDEFITRRPVLTWVADQVYLGIQRVSPALAVLTKRNSKTFLRNCQRVREGAVRYAEHLPAQPTVVCCGHTHHAEGPAVGGEGRPAYFNSGSWTESPSHYLAVTDGRVELKEVS